MALKRPVQYGIFPWWPDSGDEWIHPDDLRVARKIIPGGRVFRREQVDNEYFELRYGRARVRVKPALWKVVQSDGFDVGDRVEILSRLNLNRPAIGVIRDMHWDADTRQIRYYVRSRGQKLPRSYSAEDLRRISPLDPPSRVSVVIAAGPDFEPLSVA